MRMIMKVSFPHEKFNAAVRDGTAGEKLHRILEELSPEGVWFAEMEGHRTALLVVDLDSPSQVPAYAEPWFLAFDADVEFHPAMTPADLEEAGLEALGRRWS